MADCIERGVTSFKLYLAYPQLLQVDDDVVFDTLRAGARHGGLVTVHCENGGAIEALRRQALAEGRTGVVEHRETRPAALEAEATRVGRLAEVAGAPVYVVHLSSGPGLAEVRAAQERGVALQAETCPQYLHLDATVLEGPGGENFVCTPPLRDPWHREELWEGLARGWIQTVATDHCPFWTADRRRGLADRPEGFADFTEIPGGLPGVETRLTLVWQGVGPAESPRRTGCACAPRPPPERSACSPARAASAPAPTPTSWCGTRTGPSPSTPRPCTCRSTTRPTQARWPEAGPHWSCPAAGW